MCGVASKGCEVCELKRVRWTELQNQYLPKGVREIQSFRNNLQKRQVKLFYSTHYKNNLINREYNSEIVKEGLFYGEVIERNKFSNETKVSYVILYYADNKPMHIVLDKLDDNNYMLVTVYNPQVHDWKWNKTYQKRVCFCNH